MPHSETFKIQDVLVCEDHPFVQAGLEVSLKSLIPEIQTLRTSVTGKEALRLAHEGKPDLALIDLGLPDMSGVDLIRGLKHIWADLKIIVVTSCDNAMILQQVKNLGVSGLMQKVSSLDHLRSILKKVLSCKDHRAIAMDPYTSYLLNSCDNLDFTPREYEVLQKIIQGLSNQQISDELGCALTTVRFHRANILEKTGIRNAAELTAWFLQGQRKRH